MTGTSIAEAARIVDVPRSTVREWQASALFHCHRDGSVSARGMGELRKLAEERAEEQEDEGDNEKLRQQLLQHQVRERRAIARLRELELELESGRFVKLADVQRDAEDAGERIIAVLRAVPQRTALALECACRTAAVVEVKISDEIERAIAELGESQHARKKK